MVAAFFDLVRIVAEGQPDYVAQPAVVVRHLVQLQILVAEQLELAFHPFFCSYLR